MVMYKDMMMGEVTLLCLFEACQGKEQWVFYGVYCRGLKREWEMLWLELERCRQK